MTRISELSDRRRHGAHIKVLGSRTKVESNTGSPSAARKRIERIEGA
jgi:hypothetical protein